MNSVPEVTSCPAPGANGQVCTDEASVARGVHVDIWTLLPRARRIWQSLGLLSPHWLKSLLPVSDAGVAESLDSQVTRRDSYSHSSAVLPLT